MIKRATLSLLLFSAVAVQAQSLPTEKASKAYFKELQTKQVSSTDYISWYQVSPGTSGYCEMIWMHPTDSKTMIMSPDMFNTYGSWDGGESWLTVKDCDGMGKKFWAALKGSGWTVGYME